jgi:ATP-dependent DNA ligase
MTGRFVIGGVGACAGHQGGVLVGEWQGVHLLYRGFVDIGLSCGALDTLRTEAQPLGRPTSPFAELQRRKETAWVEPVLEAEVSYGRIVGGQLREPVLRRFATERTPA